MNNYKRLLTILLLALPLVFFSCSSGDSNKGGGNVEPMALLEVSDDGVTSFIVANLPSIMDVTDPIDADEIEFIYALREDEKISRDLALSFAELYPNEQFFRRVANAGTTHIETIEALLDYYEIEYPKLSARGLFSDEARQEHYDQLLEMGNTEENAYRAIAQLEEEDIVAYSEVLNDISNPNIEIVVSNLLRSSKNHLRAVVRQINRLGGEYRPLLLDEATYDKIVSSAPEKGDRYHCKGGTGDGGRCHGEGHHNHNHHKHGEGDYTNSGKSNGHRGSKGSVNSSGDCTGSSGGGSGGGGHHKGKAGKGYRGGR